MTTPPSLPPAALGGPTCPGEGCWQRLSRSTQRPHVADKFHQYLTHRLGALDAIRTMETAPVLRTVKAAGPITAGDPAVGWTSG
jgi:hypothetical protein